MAKPRILVVDDEETIRHILVNVIEERDCETREAGSAEDALALLGGFIPDVAMLDIVLPGRSGLDLLNAIKQRSPDTEVVMMTSHSSAETALRAIREGAYTYLQKPFENLEEIWTTVQRALEKRALTQKNRSLLQASEETSLELSSDIPLAPAAGTLDTSSYSEIIEYFMDLITRELAADGTALLLLDESSQELRVVAHRGATLSDPAAVRVRRGDGISGAVAQKGTPCVPGAALRARVPTNGAVPHPSEALFAEPIALCVPVRTESAILGAFLSTARRSGGLFSDDDVAHVSSLAGQLAVAIDGARRADRLRQAYESLKATQEQLVRSERIKAIGQMAAGVAHDFNNALSVILARAEFIHRSLETGTLDRGKALSDLETIIKTALQGSETIKRIQEYTRLRKDEPRLAVDLNTAVRDAIEISKPRWKQEAEKKGLRIDVQVDLGKVPQVTGNIYELTQVVENLIFNAVDAMPRGGRLSFTTMVADGAVVLEVTDTGIGMDAETCGRLFEPFFTTKESGQGLGTSIIYGIITRHKGTIKVRSMPGQGTTFRITLPPHVPGSEPAATPPPHSPVEPRVARILLIDDEAAVRDAYEEALVSSGQEVRSVSGGEEALSIFAQETFDIVITDLSMEGMSGFEVAGAIKKLAPGIPIILLSGWAVEQDETQIREAGIDAILIKPCRVQDLRNAVQNALQKPSKG